MLLSISLHCHRLRSVLTLALAAALWMTAVPHVAAEQAKPTSQTQPVFTTLYQFQGGDDGRGPKGLVFGNDGELYGTTQGGMSFPDQRSFSRVFKITTSGAFTLLHTFTDPDGFGPSTLIKGKDCNFYGVAAIGGASDDGAIFKISETGEFTTLHSFTGPDGSTPVAALLQASDDNFYGITFAGTVFMMQPDGTVTVLHALTYAEGGIPYGALVQDKTGNLFGTTSMEGELGAGSLFKVTTTGKMTILHSFSGPEGAWSLSGLILGPSGNLYGATAEGGVDDHGVVFKMTPDGTVTVLHTFGGKDGSDPMSKLLLASDGNLYGTTSIGGPSWDGHDSRGHGTIFRLTPDGALTVLHTFDGTDGEHPNSSLVQGSDGSLYGTTWMGGKDGYGTVYKLTMPSPTKALPETSTTPPVDLHQPTGKG